MKHDIILFGRIMKTTFGQQFGPNRIQTVRSVQHQFLVHKAYERTQDFVKSQTSATSKAHRGKELHETSPHSVDTSTNPSAYKCQQPEIALQSYIERPKD